MADQGMGWNHHPQAHGHIDSLRDSCHNVIAQITGLMGALRRMASLLAVITLAFSTVVWAESVQAITAP